MNEKRCSICRQLFPATTEFFNSNRAQRDGLTYYCRPCRGAIRRKRYAEDAGFRKARIEKQRALYQRNAKQYRECDRERRKARYAADPEKWRAKKRVEMAKRTPEHRRRNLQRWRAANPEAAREQSARARRKNPLRYRVSCLVRMHLVAARLPRSRAGFEALVEYSVEDLREHLERQFTRQMSWENYGSYWELDHIIPIRLFKVREAGDEEFRAAWALTNLRPLTTEANRSKGGKRTLLL